jgi:hypothetical protein
VADCITVIPRSFVVGSFKIDNVNQGNINRDRFSDINAILKWGGWSKAVYFEQEKKYIYTYDKFIKNMKSDKQVI